MKAWLPATLFGISGIPLIHFLQIGWFLMLAALLVSPPVHRWLEARGRISGKPYGAQQATQLAVGLVIAGPVLLAIALALTSGGSGSTKRAEGQSPALAPRTDPTTALPASPKPAPVNFVNPDSSMRAAQDALNAGDISGAVRLFFAAPVTADDRASPEGKRLKDAIQAASDAREGADPDTDFADHVRSYELPHLKAMATSEPDTREGIWQRIAAYEETARVLEEHPVSGMKPDALRARRELSQALASRQATDFPVLRRAYGKLMRDTLWENDVEVVVQGEGARTIRFIGALFAANRNIAATQQGASDQLAKLRFSRSQYEWYRGSPAPSYSLERAWI